ncbi:AB hydrolase superfamily protein YdjP [Roseibium album]|nr:AB hydrolase superfamily protein YdjP [Roseibium album]
MTTYEIAGGGGLPISVQEFGNPDGVPILFIHGLMQCGLSWTHQTSRPLAQSFRLLCMDVRGHGMSGRAATATGYQDSQFFAEDVAAVIGTLGLNRPILVGASYAGLVINDYLSVYGDAKLGGINYVASTVYFGSDKANAHLGEGLLALVPGLLSNDTAENIAATRDFVRLFYADEPSREVIETVLAYNMMVPVDVRTALASRELDGDAAMAAVRCPVLITHGLKDAVVKPSMSEAIKARIPHADVSLFPDAGHTTYGEDPERFNRDLAAFAKARDLA